MYLPIFEYTQRCYNMSITQPPQQFASHSVAGTFLSWLQQQRSPKKDLPTSPSSVVTTVLAVKRVSFSVPWTVLIWWEHLRTQLKNTFSSTRKPVSVVRFALAIVRGNQSTWWSASLSSNGPNWSSCSTGLAPKLTLIPGPLTRLRRLYRHAFAVIGTCNATMCLR